MLRTMLIRVGDPSLIPNLCAHFRRSGFVAEPAGGTMATVNRPDAPSPEQERREIAMHLNVWRVLVPGVGVELVD